MAKFGDRLRGLREESRLSMSEAARRVGVSVPYWSDVENGKRNPFRGEKLMAIANLFSADREELELLALMGRSRLSISLDTLTEKQTSVLAQLTQSVERMTDEELEKLQQLLIRSAK